MMRDGMGEISSIVARRVMEDAVAYDRFDRYRPVPKGQRVDKAMQDIMERVQGN